MSKVLLVEDDSAIRDPLARALGREGYEVVVHETGAGALEAVDNCDVVVLDLGLPDMEGLDVARRIRARGLQMPILILTARAEEVDMVVGLDAGADDYVTKPFRLAELMARVRALLRRSVAEGVSSSDLTAQDVRVDLSAHRAFRSGVELQLTAKEFDLLATLVGEAGNVVSRETLMRKVWGTDPNSSSKTLDMHISWLRRKLDDDAGHPRYIATVRGMGFRFEAAADA
ncbi:response regulator transcription factor [Boudabousia marimammalium]|uniref:DNA-binding response regulator n=1 Tax=Boudabousia marimammalium TaxID=156892 RepID=A0A1Q5PS97_9ACTO|nr:response regulator transcription factor [Boudabousia marimammalium]OKL50379.1 DNA-binding response regulator [Boudabousia marimammalium]